MRNQSSLLVMGGLLQTGDFKIKHVSDPTARFDPERTATLVQWC